MNYAGLVDCSICDGEGFRVVLFVQGCEHNCKGCHNPETHNRLGGKVFSNEVVDKIFTLLKRPYIKGITFSGGDPMAVYNRDTVITLAKQIKEELPDKDIWLYTGYTLIDLLKQDVDLSPFDVIVDGKFIMGLADKTLAFRGSSNQKIHKITI